MNAIKFQQTGVQKVGAESNEQQCRMARINGYSACNDRRAGVEGCRKVDQENASLGSQSTAYQTNLHQSGYPAKPDNGQKVVLITGASSGIGEAAAVEYAKLGYRVAITGRDVNRLNGALKNVIEQSPSKDPADFLTIRADFEDPKQVAPVIANTIDKFGRLDIFINNAGYRGLKRCLWDPDFFDDFQKIVQVNLMAATQLAQLASEHLVKTGGVILNVSSIADRIPMPQISYSVAKAGMSMLTKSLANALEGRGVRVVGISPGPISTNFSHNTRTDAFVGITSVGRQGLAKEVADLILFLTSEKAAYIQGCTIDIDGGVLAKYGGVFGLPRVGKATVNGHN